MTMNRPFRLRTGAPIGRASGFTLLEIVIVIAIIALLAGGAVAAMVYNSSKRKLQAAGAEIETLAKRARAVAILRQTPYALVFFEGRVRMQPLAEVGTDDPEMLAELDAAATAHGRTPPVRDEFAVDPGMVLGLRRWGGDRWLVFDNPRTGMVWRFDPDGLCEPVTIRIEIDDGKSWLEQEYHPLTAAVRDFAMVAK
jgi:prepilin-type N-terminal cleavage/methylation domain-containing protein